MHHADLDRDHADGVAVGRARRDRLVPHHARAAGAIHDVHGLAEFLLKEAADDARGGVGSTAGTPRHDQRDGALGIGGERRRGEAGERKRERACGPDDGTHGSPPLS